jgi:DNA-binding HxlR family transcriptional regulator
VKTIGVEPTRALCDRSLNRVFEFLGKRWNGVILGSLVGGPASFSGLARSVCGISDSVLSERLAGLVEGGLVVRTVCAGPPVAVIYDLSDSGKALVPALTELTRWAERDPR